MTTPAESGSLGVSPEFVLLGMANAFIVSRAIQVASDLEIADHIDPAGSTIEELAAATRTHPDSLYRLLRMLASHGIFAEDEAGRIHLTDLAEPLRSDAPNSVRDVVRIVDVTLWKVYGELGHSVATGTPAFDLLVGQGFFEHQDTNPAANDRFAVGMATLSAGEDPLVAAAYDFCAFPRIVDVGGGRGGLLAEILTACPMAHGVLFDRAAVAAEPVHIDRAGVRDRCAVKHGDFFNAVPKGHDLYIVKRILHDWPDDHCVTILRNCAASLNANGRVLVVDAVVPPGNAADPMKDMDLMMLALLGGKERTAEQFDELFREAGLRRTRIIPLPAPVSLIEAELIG